MDGRVKNTGKKRGEVCENPSPKLSLASPGTSIHSTRSAALLLGDR